jgi:ribonucleoside-diphosphate reductase alpha chain
MEKEPVKWSSIFSNMMNKWEFIPAGRILANAGTPNNNLFNCFVLPVEDSLEGIFDAVKWMCLIQQRGGGTGFNFSKLRPKGSTAKSSNSVASGVCSFIEVFDKASNVILSGSRRAANMGLLSVYHPEIVEFINYKRTHPGSWERFNISVVVDDSFFNAVDNDLDIELVHNGKTYQVVKAKTIWNDICWNAWAYADPGVINLETANREFNYESFMGSKVEAVNPCSEQILHPFDQCDLGSVNLVAMLDNINDDNVEFNFERFKTTVKHGIRFLDNVYDVTTFPLPQNKEFGLKYRRVGLGIMGYADACYLLGIPYSKSSKFAEDIMRCMIKTAYEATIELAIEKGKNEVNVDKYVEIPFVMRNVPELVPAIRKFGIRNMNLLSIAPTGTISQFAGVSSGIEPLFAHSYWRKDAVSILPREIIHKAYEFAKSKNNFDELNARGVFETAHDVTPMDHVLIQSVFAKFVDTNISKTVNLPENATVKDVDETFRTSLKNGIKSTTIYRAGSRNGVLTKKDDGLCPSCSSKVQNEAHCIKCDNCGWSACSI